MDNPSLLLPTEAARFLRLSEAALAKWRCQGRGPKYVKVGGRILYRGRDLETYLEEHTRGASDAAPVNRKRGARRRRKA